MANTIIPNSVYRRVQAGPVKGVVPYIERQPNGDNLIGLAPPTMTVTKASIGRCRPGEQVDWNVQVTPTGAEAQPLTHTFTGGPAEIRRTARERYQELLRKLWQDGTAHFYKDGEIVWPKSVLDEIAVLGIAQGNLSLAQQVEEVGRFYIEKGARQQRAQDQRSVTADWHGHLSA